MLPGIRDVRIVREVPRAVEEAVRIAVLGRTIAVDDCSPEPKLSAWLERLAAAKRIDLLRNRRNRGFVAAVNIGIKAAGTHDVVLLNSDTEVPAGWLARLAGHAYATPRVASVSPISNNATICGYPGTAANPPAFGLDVTELDAACHSANAGRSVELPTTGTFAVRHWPTSACSTSRRSAAVTARRTISACVPARAAGGICWPATPSSTTWAR
jgi:hypothetical protein